ncbi:hypothetical protein KTE26_15920 [Ralstonia mannitolilytica]|uniref:SDH family Clp fold serine proteinase n=1 Tax=Ralstonia mannitolilytica TaxID=105219 RepID=UPI000CEEF7F3|nr:serine protease [Ralstonia mannitolilytica]MBU9579922.1 hypothetical protein [Ralstonia mannitolilytica]
MPNSSEVLAEIDHARQSGTVDPIDTVRRRHLAALAAYTQRNVIAYYSGWLTVDPTLRGIAIGDEDKNGFMTAIHRMDRTKGLDLILHTPGGDIAAAESLGEYLRAMFGTDIRVIVPQLAMSAGTMIACASKVIFLGKQSSLGPFDPQSNGISLPAVLDEFKRAINEIKADPASTPLWQVIIGKYHPTFLDSCHRATVMSKDIVRKWLVSGMFEGDPDALAKASAIVDYFSNHDEHKTHSRHVHYDACAQVGLKVSRLEDDAQLQDLVLTVHHAYMHTCGLTHVIKIIESHEGQAVVMKAQAPMQGLPFPFMQMAAPIPVAAPAQAANGL